MVNIAICVLPLFLLLAIAELLGRHRLAGPEVKRKFFHITSSCLIAFWPWLISWRTIEILCILMLAGVVANTFIKLFDFTRGIGRRSYGDCFLAMAIGLCAYFAHSKVIFALAILNVAIADGLAAIIGKKFGKPWRYRILGQSKSVIGSMAFWLVSLIIFGIGLLFLNVGYNQYILLLIILPPALAVVENFSVAGIDNLTVPLLALAVLRLAT